MKLYIAWFEDLELADLKPDGNLLETYYKDDGPVSLFEGIDANECYAKAFQSGWTTVDSISCLHESESIEEMITSGIKEALLKVFKHNPCPFCKGKGPLIQPGGDRCCLHGYLEPSLKTINERIKNL